jgi:hypothetical protein
VADDNQNNCFDSIFRGFPKTCFLRKYPISSENFSGLKKAYFINVTFYMWLKHLFANPQYIAWLQQDHGVAVGDCLTALTEVLFSFNGIQDNLQGLQEQIKDKLGQDKMTNPLYSEFLSSKVFQGKFLPEARQYVFSFESLHRF